MITSEIGGLGWGFCPNRVYDGAGLVSPSNLKYHPMQVPTERSSGGWGAIPVGAVIDARADYIVSMPIFSEAVARALSSGAMTGYQLAEGWPEDVENRRRRSGISAI